MLCIYSVDVCESQLHQSLSLRLHFFIKCLFWVMSKRQKDILLLNQQLSSSHSFPRRVHVHAHDTSAKLSRGAMKTRRVLCGSRRLELLHLQPLQIPTPLTLSLMALPSDCLSSLLLSLFSQDCYSSCHVSADGMTDSLRKMHTTISATIESGLERQLLIR